MISDGETWLPSMYARFRVSISFCLWCLQESSDEILVPLDLTESKILVHIPKEEEGTYNLMGELSVSRGCHESFPGKCFLSQQAENSEVQCFLLYVFTEKIGYLPFSIWGFVKLPLLTLNS